MKRNIFGFLVVAILAISLIPGTAFAAASADNVSIDEAQIAASNCIERNISTFPEWDGATISKPVVYFSPDSTQSAYEFSVLNKGEAVGYIFVSARKDWMPILEYSNGKAPSSYVTDAISLALEEGYVGAGAESEPIFFYWGACTYSVQFGEKMKSDGLVYILPTGLISNLPEKTPSLQIEANQARVAWANINQKEIDSYEYCISGVPAFYQGPYVWSHGDDHDPDADDWPDCAGVADDLWADWDGCAPIAGAMVIGYWHDNGYSSIPDPDTSGTEDTLIDHCHYAMDTDYDGGTSIDDIAWGLVYVPSLYGYYSFVAWTDEATWSWAVDEIEVDRPFSLALVDAPAPYYNHGVCAYGYKDDTQDYIIIHNDWDTSKHYITWGDWGYAQMDTLEPPYK